MWSSQATPGIIDIMPESNGFLVFIEELAISEVRPFLLVTPSYRRPRQDMAVIFAKSSCFFDDIGKSIELEEFLSHQHEIQEQDNFYASLRSKGDP